MTISDIISAVRWCIDEESNNNSDMADVIDEMDDSYMNNIIKSKITEALHWIAITATSSSALSGSSTVSSTTKSEDKDNDVSSSTVSSTTNMEVEKFEETTDIGVITMPENISVFNINRVRAKGWHKAVVPIEDTDNEALMMFDETAKGTLDRPIAAIMRTKPIQILVQPIPNDGNITVSYVGVPNSKTENDNVDISDTFKGAFIYYLAYLVMCAYDDTKANQMYTIALQQLGVNQAK